ncbi:DNA-(apurinic or apyrimidinic site) lyase 1 [Sphaceloma murrayae]|uniref:Apurinic-apyrimidinic endonuclease 1 n=1 Tax=Sphaceloma murrayae TaxID=2082308 RepID=A0A2K1QM74_9PEZI|nr:DNA-(apurinic or apyrimidinic site) lyase 1 [Sphaceloma murrayae]
MPRKSTRMVARDISSDLSPAPEAAEDPRDEPVATTKGKKRKRVNGHELTSTTPAKTNLESEVTTVKATSGGKKRTSGIGKSNGTTVKAEEETTTTPRSSRKRQAVTYTEDEPADIDPATTTPKSRSSKKLKAEQIERVITSTSTTTTTAPNAHVADADADDKPKDPPPSKPKKPRKTKAELAAAKEAAMIPLAARSASLHHIGAHVSAAGGVHNAVAASHHIGGNAFALFLKSQRKWTNPPLGPDVAAQFASACKEHSYSAGEHVVPHGSYLVNLAHTDPERTRQAYDAFLDDLKRCEMLGIGLYNFHPGNVQGTSREEAIGHLARNLNRAHRETKGVVTLLENMAATGGNVIGCRFEELGAVIKLVEEKERVGVCLDTCHAFAAGYDLRTKEGVTGVLDELDRTVGIKYLRALHMNDSKAPIGSGRDLHANIGTGFIGLKGFHAIMNEERLRGLPMVLETPLESYDEEGNRVKDDKGLESEGQKAIWAGEIKLLESLVDMDAETDDFRELESRLAKRGQKERARIQDQVDRRDEKASKPKRAKKSGKRKAAGAATSDEDSES